MATYNRFRALGAFVNTGENLTDEQLDKFAWAGGKWIAPVLYGDDAAAPWNVKNITKLQNRANARGLEVAGWFNVFNDKPVSMDVKNISAIVKNYKLPLAIVDAEHAYQYPAPGCQVLPELMQKLRQALLYTDLQLSSLGPNNAYIYNNRNLSPQKSMYNLG
jgi:hypothetical protein